jgi:hypothetical protein
MMSGGTPVSVVMRSVRESAMWSAVVLRFVTAEALASRGGDVAGVAFNSG